MNHLLLILSSPLPLQSTGFPGHEIQKTIFGYFPFVRLNLQSGEASNVASPGQKGRESKDGCSPASNPLQTDQLSTHLTRPSLFNKHYSFTKVFPIWTSGRQVGVKRMGIGLRHPGMDGRRGGKFDGHILVCHATYVFKPRYTQPDIDLIFTPIFELTGFSDYVLLTITRPFRFRCHT